MDLKVCIVSHVYPYPGRGYNPGIERLVEGVSEALVKKGVSVSVITSKVFSDNRHEIIPSGVEIYRTNKFFRVKYSGIFGLNMLSFSLSACKFVDVMKHSDVVHILSASFIPLPPLKSVLPPILSYFPHLDRPKTFKEFLWLPEVNFMLFLIYKYSDLVVAGIPPNSLELHEFVSFFRLPPEKIRFTYQGVDTDKFNINVNGREIRKKFGDNIVLYTGPLQPRKGIIYLLKAIPQVIREVPSAKFVFVGGGNLEEYSSLSRRLGVDKYVFFEGFVPESKLSKYYAAADVFAFPTLKDGYAFVCLESMIHGTPLVATNLSPISTMIGDCGILVEPRNPNQLSKGIIRLLNDESLRKKLGERARERVTQNYSWSVVIDRWIDIYRQAINLK